MRHHQLPESWAGLPRPANLTRESFLKGLAAVGGLAAAMPARAAETPATAAVWPLDTRDLDVWQRETDAVRPATYKAYFDGKRPAAGLAPLERLEAAWTRVTREIETTRVDSTPAVWMVYNMGVVVKTRESLFSIDLVHRRALELAPKLDFALITHNHDDHYRTEFYRALNKSGKTVINNFIDNYGAADWRKSGPDWCAAGGYTRAEKTFKIRDVEIRTALTDHNSYLIDYTTAFEIRVGNWKMYHTGDCSNVSKLKNVWGRPDLWIVFPGCGINIAAGAKKIAPGKMAFGHLWELAHETGRLTTPMVRAATARVQQATGQTPTVPLWGERIV